MMEMSYKPAQGRPGRSTPTSGPFGYPMPPLDTPYDSAPLPHGPALLDDTETNMLDNFFSTMNESHFDNADFWFGLETDKPFGFEWQEELPPNFEGSTTSLPQQYLPTTPRATQSPIAHHGKTNAPLTSDVIEAASTLYQNGAVPHDFMSNFTEQVFTENGLEDAGHVLPAFKRARLGFGPDGSSAEGGFFEKGIHTANAQFGPQGQSTSGHQASTRKADPLRWGSDASFSDQRYEAPPDQETVEGRTKELLTHLDCLEPQSSAANTRPSSPTRKPVDPSKPDWEAALNGSQQNMKPYIDNDGALLDDASRPRKRRKSKGKDNDIISEVDLPLSTHHFPTAKDRRLSSTMDALPRRLKGQGSIAKPPRENLTEEQKRTNHILSEQKRRNLIKQGFDDLCTLVPDLHGGGYSKSTMLMQAGDWLQDLINGNEQLKAQLAELNGQSSTNCE